MLIYQVISPDGTPIACFHSGAGTPLVLVHGSGAANALAWKAVLPTLQERFRMVVIDRRGHGQSGDAPAYAIEREVEDIAAVIDALGEPADLLGHSFGALCALEAALLARNLRRLILYEPAMSLAGEELYPPGAIQRMHALLAAGDREGILTMLYREIVGISPAEFAFLKSSPAWSQRLASAHTVPREAQAEENYRFDAGRFKDLKIPVLLLSGGDSPAFLTRPTQMIHAALPDSRIAVLPGQQHTAMYSAPDLFLHEVLAFLGEPG
jgi:pimeloyl-ACP methyl ester carboxylesterase